MTCDSFKLQMSSVQSGKHFEYNFQQFLLSNEVTCSTPDLLVQGKSIDNVCQLQLEKVLSFFCDRLGKPRVFKVYRDSEGQAQNGGHSADIHIEFIDLKSQKVNNCFISLKKNNCHLKSQRLRNLACQMGTPKLESTYKEGLDGIFEELFKKYTHVCIFAELNEYEKLHVYITINRYVAEHIRDFAKTNLDHTHYINFLRGGDTQWILVQKETHLLLYRLPEIEKHVKISAVEAIGDSIFMTLTNKCIFRLRLHNDKRHFNTKMSLKYATTMVDIRKMAVESYEVSASSLTTSRKEFSSKELCAIEKEQRRRVMSAKSDSALTSLCEKMQSL